MLKPKVVLLPLHEILSTDLYVLGASIRAGAGRFMPEKTAPVRLILGAFRRAKLKPEHAHEIASAHAGLPAILSEAGQIGLSIFATEVLADLVARKDEKKGEGEASTAQTSGRRTALVDEEIGGDL